MNARSESRRTLLAWLEEERARLAADIERFSSGNAQLMERRNGRLLDVSGETLRDFYRRKSELDRHIEALGGTTGA